MIVDHESLSELETIERNSGLRRITDRAWQNVSTGAFYVLSNSKRFSFHEVTDGMCDCAGFMYRHTCSHVQCLVKDGFLTIDMTDMSYKPTGKNPDYQPTATTVVSGLRYVDEELSTMREQRLSGQVRRIQNLWRLQSNVAKAQARLLRLIQLQQTSGIGAAMQAIEQARKEHDDALSKLRPGDLVELDVS